MKLKGFRFRDCIYLEAAGETFDLHNCFSFVGFTYDLGARTLVLNWHPGSYAPSPEQHRIEIEFQGVSHLSAEPRDPTVPFTEDDCLECVAYVSATNPMEENCVCDNQGTDAHCLFYFMSRFVLRVYADTAVCRIE